MRGSRILAWAVLLSAVAATSGARAQESYNGLIIGPMASEGRRWGWGAEPGATIGSVGVFGGARLERWRIGLFEQNTWWVGSHGVVLDFGGFIGLDWASLWLDPQLSAALFSRIEPALRFKTNESVWALAPSGVVGGRLFGVEIGFLATPEIWLSTLPNNGNKLGVDLQVRLSCDLVELTHLVQHLSAARDQPTP